MIDGLMKELGLHGGSLNGMVGSAPAIEAGQPDEDSRPPHPVVAERKASKTAKASEPAKAANNGDVDTAA
jgi:hypothetical protein